MVQRKEHNPINHINLIQGGNLAESDPRFGIFFEWLWKLQAKESGTLRGEVGGMMGTPSKSQLVCLSLVADEAS